MAAISPCKIICYQNYRLNKGSPSSHNAGPAYSPSLLEKTNSNKPYSTHGYAAEAAFDNRLQALEKDARDQYLKILKSLTFKKLPKWFDHMLDQSLLPTLNRIGFDDQISKALFQIALSSWKLMGPQNDKVVAFQPAINQQIEEVRQGLEMKAGQNGDKIPRLRGALLQIIPGSIKEGGSPENLFDLLNEIATPWIILPRAYRFLKKRQCSYLPVYLVTIDRVTQELSLKLFSRIAVEFMGNFSLKFADRHHPPDKIAKLLFYGYSVLFWKTLRCPPASLENSAAFDNYFNWICRLKRKSEFLGDEEKTSINRMMEMRKMIFPTRILSRSQIRGRPDISRFIVTLRHGCIGIATTLKYFGIDQFLETRKSGDRFASQSFQNELHNLLHFIQRKYHLESKQTKENIKLFIGRLRSAYMLMRSNFHRPEKHFLNRMFCNLQILMSK